MSSTPKPSLHIRATSLRPVASLDSDLSKFAQNLVYARNGTGKSFLTRALRYLDLHGEGQGVEDAAGNLISEESTSGRGLFELSQGDIRLGKLTLNAAGPQVVPEIDDRIFHVFSEDFVQIELRQSNFVVNGNIESKITLDHSIISTKDAEEKLKAANTRLEGMPRQLGQTVVKAKEEQLATKAGVNKRLKEYINIQLQGLLASHQTSPQRAARTPGDILNDLDALKSVPAEPDHPVNIENVFVDLTHFDTMRLNLEKITSSSTVAEEIKAKIALHPIFVETGLEIMEDGHHENCPFCQQSVIEQPAKDLIASYIAYFADAEGAHKKALRDDWSRVKAIRTALTNCQTSFARSASKYESLRRLVPSQKNAALPDLPKQVHLVDDSLGVYAEAIRVKGGDTGGTVAVPEIDVSGIFATLRDMINTINQAFTALRDAVSASDAERRNLHREACQVFEIEFVRSNWLLFESFRTLEADVRTLAAELAALERSQLSDNAKDRVAATFESLLVSFFGQKYTFDRRLSR